MRPVQVLTEADLHRRRLEALARVVVTETELRRRGAEFRLGPTELAVLDELDDINFLLGEP